MNKKAIGIGIGVAGAVAAAAGIAALTGRKASAPVAGPGPLGRALPASSGSVVNGSKTLRMYNKKNFPLAERVALLQDLVVKGVTDPEMRKLALQITRNCEARDGLCEIRSIYEWVKANVRYTGDIAPHRTASGAIEAVDLFQSAQRTIEFGGGDCDDMSVLVAVLLILNGIPALFKITARSPGPQEDWSHIYVIAVLPKIGTPQKYIPVDCTLPGSYFSVEYPYGKARTFIA